MKAIILLATFGCSTYTDCRITDPQEAAVNFCRAACGEHHLTPTHIKMDLLDRELPEVQCGCEPPPVRR